MKATLRAALLSMALAGTIVMPAAAAEQPDMNRLKGEAKEIIQHFFKELKGTLVSAMKEKGPAGAVDVCHSKAQEITAKYNREGWKVGRTALKIRNPKNAPDAWEKAVLREFEKKIAEGADPKKLARAEVVEQDGKKVFRFMKAIPVGKPCLNCHGEKVREDVLAVIRKHYPQDQATGFKLGQLRGAFTLSRPLD